MFPEMILVFHATCLAGTAQPGHAAVPVWTLKVDIGQVKQAAKTDRLADPLVLIRDTAFWLDPISGLDCNLLILLTPAVSDYAFSLEEYGLSTPPLICW